LPLRHSRGQNTGKVSNADIHIDSAWEIDIKHTADVSKFAYDDLESEVYRVSTARKTAA
jgi:hypothetical protein